MKKSRFSGQLAPEPTAERDNAMCDSFNLNGALQCELLVKHRF